MHAHFLISDLAALCISSTSVKLSRKKVERLHKHRRVLTRSRSTRRHHEHIAASVKSDQFRVVRFPPLIRDPCSLRKANHIRNDLRHTPQSDPRRPVHPRAGTVWRQQLYNMRPQNPTMSRSLRSHRTASAMLPSDLPGSSLAIPPSNMHILQSIEDGSGPSQQS